MLAKGLNKPRSTGWITDWKISLHSGQGDQKIWIFGNAVWFIARFLHMTETSTICNHHFTLHLASSACLDKEHFWFSNESRTVVSIKWGGDVLQGTYLLITSHDTSLISMTHHATDEAVSVTSIFTVFGHKLFYLICSFVCLDFNQKAQKFK